MSSTDLPQRVLKTLDSASSLPVASSEAFPDVESTVLKGALDSLHGREMITYTTENQEVAVLTEEAEGIVADGSHEVKVYNAVCAALEGLAIKDLPVSHQFISTGTMEVVRANSGCCGALERRWQGIRQDWTRESVPEEVDQEGW